jgi:hypothetical protein
MFSPGAGDLDLHIRGLIWRRFVRILHLVEVMLGHFVETKRNLMKVKRAEN